MVRSLKRTEKCVCFDSSWCKIHHLDHHFLRRDQYLFHPRRAPYSSSRGATTSESMTCNSDLLFGLILELLIPCHLKWRSSTPDDTVGHLDGVRKIKTEKWVSGRFQWMEEEMVKKSTENECASRLLLLCLALIESSQLGIPTPLVNTRSRWEKAIKTNGCCHLNP